MGTGPLDYPRHRIVSSTDPNLMAEERETEELLNGGDGWESPRMWARRLQLMNTYAGARFERATTPRRNFALHNLTYLLPARAALREAAS